jgi:hypothetical protein
VPPFGSKPLPHGTLADTQDSNYSKALILNVTVLGGKESREVVELNEVRRIGLYSNKIIVPIGKDPRKFM